MLTFWLFRSKNYERQTRLHPSKVMLPSEKTATPHLKVVFYFIQTNVISQKLHSFEKASMEILSICLKTTKSTRLELCNVYQLTTPSQHNSFNPSLIKPCPSSLILGDLSYVGSTPTVMTKFSTRSLTMIYIFLMIALLLKPVESPVMTAPQQLPLWEKMVSKNVSETSRSYWQLWPFSYFNQN